MHNIWLVARHEFWTNVRKRSFLFAVFGIPALMGVIFAIVFLVADTAEERGVEIERMGYVDEAEVLSESVEPPEGFVLYDDAEAAQAALDADEIDAYILLPERYMARGTVELYAYGGVSEDVEDEIRLFLVANLTADIESDAPPERLTDPVDSIIFLENSQRELSEQGIIGLFIVPILFAVVLMMALQFSSQFLMSGIVEEKSNHIMEILITSITPYELLTGKLIGLGALGLVQLGVWLVLGGVLLIFGGNIEFLSAVVIPLDFVIVVLLYFFLTYFLVASLLSGVGAVMGSEQESRQYAGLFMFMLAIPLFFFSLLLTNPESPVFVGLTLFPFTSAMTYMLRYPFSSIPTWQVIASLLILALTTGFVMWASAKVFRWALLLYGKKVGIGTLLRVIRRNPEIGSLPAQSSAKEGRA